MKTCTRCKESKSLDLFSRRSKSKDGRSSWCKSCFAKNAAAKYQNDPDERARKRRNRKSFWESNQQRVLEFLRDRSCADCGEDDFRTFEFDHRDPKKKSFNISDMYKAYRWERILDEISKCDVVCANCHRIRTWTMFGGWRMSAQLDMA